MNLYKWLEKNQKNRNINSSRDTLFYLENRHLLANIPLYKKFENTWDDFDIIRADIILHALLNKARLDEAITYAYKTSKIKTEDLKDYIFERMTDHPYLMMGKEKIYIPVFPKGINALYTNSFGRLLTSPYNTLLTEFSASCIDLFEVYNFALFTSMFTRLIKIYEDEHLLVMYHYDFRTLYFINDQGRLDAKLALFDKYVKKVNATHISRRAQPVVKAYLRDNRELLYEELIKNEFVSEKLINKIKTAEFKFRHKKETRNI